MFTVSYTQGGIYIDNLPGGFVINIILEDIYGNKIVDHKESYPTQYNNQGLLTDIQVTIPIETYENMFITVYFIGEEEIYVKVPLFNLTQYYHCLERELGIIEFKDCDSVFQGCGECSKIYLQIYNLLQTIEIIFVLDEDNNIDDLVNILKTLDALCDNCSGCKKINSIILPEENIKTYSSSLGLNMLLNSYYITNSILNYIKIKGISLEG